MRRFLKIFAVLAALLTVAAALFLVPTIWFKPWSVDHFYARVFVRYALKHPMMLSTLRVLEPMGLRFHNDDLDDLSTEFALREARWLDKQLGILHRYDRDSMSEDGRLSYDVMDWFMAVENEGTRWIFHDYPVTQMGGVQTGLPSFMISFHHLGDLRDAEDYVARVSKFGVAFDQVIDGLRERERRGIVPPRFALEKALLQVRKVESTPVGESPLLTHLRDRLGSMEGIDAARREALMGRLRGAIEGTFVPACGRLAAALEHLASVSAPGDGAWRLPEGDAYYAWLLRRYTTTEMTPDQVHELGLREVGRLEEEMRAILDAQGFAGQGIREAMARLNAEPRFLYPDTDEGRARILTDFQGILDDINGRLGPLFDLRPSAGVKVERVPEFQEADNAAAYYFPPSMDGARSGTFFVNLRKVPDIIRFRMRTLAYHEAIPGHHFQTAIQQEIRDVPFFRRVIPFAAYSEGWALYAERLAAENGFEDNPYDRLGYLSDQMLRAVRLVVDTGIHTRRWSRDEAVRYMLDHTGMPETEAVAEVERYVVDPGQACAYMVGMLKILDLRQRAMERLGDRFDIRRFHNVILRGGAMPLSLLERQVDAWIASQGKA